MEEGLLTYVNGSSVISKRSESRAEKAAKLGSGILLSVGKLVEAKKVALRRAVWFRALNRVERGIIDLTVKVVDCMARKHWNVL
jgi:hypothetical protein